jgi:hypothetical protein
MNKAILNITYDGLSCDVPAPLDHRTSDFDIKRIAVEVIRSGDLPGLRVAGLRDDAFRHYVVDRFDTPAGGKRLYLRPKVPFGGAT